MRLTIHLLPLAAMLQACFANFDVYFTEEANGADNINGMMVFDAPPSCSTVLNDSIYYLPTDDASGWNIGYRCDGDCNQNSAPEAIQVLEMNFNNSPVFHWSEFVFTVPMSR